jgi:hypothetical protein
MLLCDVPKAPDDHHPFVLQQRPFAIVIKSGKGFAKLPVSGVEKNRFQLRSSDVVTRRRSRPSKQHRPNAAAIPKSI